MLYCATINFYGCVAVYCCLTTSTINITYTITSTYGNIRSFYCSLVATTINFAYAYVFTAIDGYYWGISGVFSLVSSAKDLTNGISVARLWICAVNIYSYLTANYATLVTASIYSAYYRTAFNSDSYSFTTWRFIGTAIYITCYMAANDIDIDVVCCIPVITTSKYVAGYLAVISNDYRGFGNGIFTIGISIVSISGTKNASGTGLVNITSAIDVDISICGTTTIFSTITSASYPTVQSSTSNYSVSSSV